MLNQNLLSTASSLLTKKLSSNIQNARELVMTMTVCYKILLVIVFSC